MASIVGFLEARIAEDEYGANRELLLGTTMTLTRLNARTLAECAAKRAIIGEHGKDEDSSGNYCETCAEWWKYELGEGAPPVVYPCPTIRAVAAVYKDHPDYQQEWA